MRRRWRRRSGPSSSARVTRRQGRPSPRKCSREEFRHDRRGRLRGAPRHLKAIKDTGNRLVAAVDPHDAVGVLDRYSFDVRFFTEIERFDRHLEKLKRGPEAERVNFVSICSPNYLHDAHIRLALRSGAARHLRKTAGHQPVEPRRVAASSKQETGQARLHGAAVAASIRS